MYQNSLNENGPFENSNVRFTTHGVYQNSLNENGPFENSNVRFTTHGVYQNFFNEHWTFETTSIVVCNCWVQPSMIKSNVTGSKVQMNDVYKPNGINSERSAALREDLFDLMMISAPACTLPWTPERLEYLRHFYPTLTLDCIDAKNLETVMYRSWNHPLKKPISRQTYQFNRIALTWF